MKALIDGDILLYRCAAAAQSKLYICYDEQSRVVLGQFSKAKEVKEFSEGKEGLKNDWYVLAQPISNAIHNFETALAAVLRDSGSDKFTIFMSADTCFRDRISSTRKYKGNRDRTQRPVHYHRLKKYIISKYNPTIKDDMEADDLLGIEQSTLTNTIICSLDKDLDQIPGLHYDWVKKVIYNVTEEGAKRNFWVQVLTGDATDNIQGIPGIGPKTAEKLLENCSTDKEYWDVVLEEYTTLCGDSEKGRTLAIEMARLVHILKKPLIGDNYWMPPQ